MQKQFSRFEYPLQIIESHLDTFGHMNNATYLQILEQARWELITQRGFGLDKIKQTGLGPTILEIKIQFLRELVNREQVTITTQCTEYNGKVGKIRQEIIKANSEVACTAEFTVGLFDTKQRKLVAPTPEWLQAVGLAN